jgi:hypothetical protein
LSRQYETLSSETKHLKDRISQYEVPVVRIAGKTYSLLQVIEENIISSRVLSRINVTSVPWRTGNSYEDFIVEQILFSKIREEDIREKSAAIVLPAKKYSFDKREQEYLAKYLLISYLVGQTTAEPRVDEDEARRYYNENIREYLMSPAEKVVKYLFIPYTKMDVTEKMLLAADIQREAVNGQSLENIYKFRSDKVSFRQSPMEELPAVIKWVALELSDGEIKKIITEDQYIIVQVQMKGPSYRRYEDVAGEIRDKLTSGIRVPISVWISEIRKEAEEIRR